MAVDVTPMTTSATSIAGLWQLTTKTITDERGTVREFFRTSAFAAADVQVPDRWAQINMTWTHRGGVRGLHGEPMTKLIGVAAGSAFGVYLDARKDSDTFGTVVTAPLEVGTQMLVPAGVCNGFQATGDGCQYVYCFDAEWQPGLTGVAVRPTDPALNIAWPLPLDPGDAAQLSAKDAAAPLLADL